MLNVFHTNFKEKPQKSVSRTFKKYWFFRYFVIKILLNIQKFIKSWKCAILNELFEKKNMKKLQKICGSWDSKQLPKIQCNHYEKCWKSD